MTGNWPKQVLEAVWRAYRGDTAFVEEQGKRDAQREEALPELRQLVTDFAETRDALATFRDRLHTFAIDYQHLWGFSGHGMMTVNQLAKFADEEDEADLRKAVAVPSTTDEARQRIELLLAVAKGQKERAKALGKKHGPAPGHVPYVLSFLWEAFDREAWPVYFTNTRDSLKRTDRFSETGDPAADYLAFVEAAADARRHLDVSQWDFEHACLWLSRNNFAGFVPADFQGLARITELNTDEWNSRTGYATEETDHEARTHIKRVLRQLRGLGDALKDAAPDLLAERTYRTSSERSRWSETGRYRTDAWLAVEHPDDNGRGRPSFRVWVTSEEVLAETAPVGDDPEQHEQAVADAEAEIHRAAAVGFALAAASDDEYTQPWEPGAGEPVALVRRWTADEIADAGRAFLDEVVEALRAVAPVIEQWETAEEAPADEGDVVVDAPEGVPERAWQIRANVVGRDHLDQWLAEGYVAIGWGNAGRIEPGTDRQEIRELLEAGYPDWPAGRITSSLATVGRFLNDIQPGDLVVTPRDDDIYLGTISSDAYWSDEGEDAHRREVRWHNADEPLRRDELPETVVRALQSHRRTLGDVSDRRVELARLAGLVRDTADEQITFDPDRLELYVKLADLDAITAEETLTLHTDHAERHGTVWFMGNFLVTGKLAELRAMIDDGYHPKLLLAQPGKGLVAVAPILSAVSAADAIPCPDPAALPDAYDPADDYKTWLKVGRLRRASDLDVPVHAADFVVASNPALRASDLLDQRPSYAYLRYAPATVELADTPLPLPDAERFDQGFARITEKLAVDRQTVERIVANLVAGKSVILTGPTGSGKTELAHLIPEVFFDIDAHVVTATADWTSYEVVGGIFPQIEESDDGERSLSYGIRRGHVYEAIWRNWKSDASGNLLRRDNKPVRSRHERDERTYSGTWLVIDEFNRADIDKAFGELFTAIEYGQLQVPVVVPGEAAATRPLPIPQHFRIIGTMNSFDRHYLFTISDALKRRFAFIDVGLPTDTSKERDKVLFRVGTSLTERGLDVEWEDLNEAQGILYEFLGFVRAFRAVGVAQAMAALEYAAVRSAQAEPDPAAFLPEALLANVVPQLEGLSTEQLGYARAWAAGKPAVALNACAGMLDRQGPGLAARRDLLRVARYLASRCEEPAAKRSQAIADAVAAEADDQELSRLVRAGGEGDADEGVSWPDLVAADFDVEALPEVADALQALIDDAAI